MKGRRGLWALIVVLSAAAVVLCGLEARTQVVPGAINYQGRLFDGSGLPVTGSVAMEFGLWDKAVTQDPVTNENITMTGTAPVPLAHQNLVPGSVVVTFPGGSPVYETPRDYLINEVTGAITRVDGGFIIDGTQVEVDYVWTNRGNLLWSEAQAVPVAGGLYNVILGGVTPIPAWVFAGPQVYLEIVAAGETLSPRARLTSVPYAMQAETAYTCSEANFLDGFDAIDFALAIHTHDAGEIASGTVGTTYYSAYADLLEEGYLDNSGPSDLLTQGQADARYSLVGHTHGFDDITSGTVGTDYYSAYADLGAEGYLDNNDPADLVTQGQGDGRFVNTAGDDAMAGSLEVGGGIGIGSAPDAAYSIRNNQSAAPANGAVFYGSYLGVAGYHSVNTVNQGALGLSQQGVYGSAGRTTETATQIGGQFTSRTGGTAFGVSAAAEGYGAAGAFGVYGLAYGYSVGDMYGAYFSSYDFSVSGTGRSYGIYASGEDYAAWFEGAPVHVGPAGTEDYLDGTGDLYVQDALEVDGTAYVNDLVCVECVSSAEIADGTGSSLDADLLDGQHGSFYQNASNLNAGNLGESYYSAYSDLTAEGYLDNNAAEDLITQTQGDGRFVNEGQADSITSNMVQFSYAGSSSEGGPAADLACATCVSSAEMADGAALAEIADDDGAGSGLDADLLDGLHASAFVTKDGDTMTGPLSVPALRTANLLADGSALTAYPPTTDMNLSYPFFNAGRRTQTLFLSAELDHGLITGLEIEVNAGATVTFNDMRITLGTTNLTTLGSTFASNYTSSAVVRQPATFVLPPRATTQFASIPLDRPYYWDGTSNLIIEYNFSSATATVNTRGLNAVLSRFLYAAYNAATGNTASYLHRHRLTISARTQTGIMSVSQLYFGDYSTTPLNLTSWTDLSDGGATSLHTHDLSSLTGALGSGQFSAYADLTAEGYLDNSAAGDLLTQSQGDGRFVNTTGDDSMAGSLTVGGDLTVSGNNIGIGTAPNASYGLTNAAGSAPSIGAYLFGSAQGVRGAWASDPTDHYGYLGGETRGVYGVCGASDETGDRIGGYFYAGSQGNALGVYGAGYSYGSGLAMGGQFVAANSGTGAHYGVQGLSYTSTAAGSQAFGVYGGGVGNVASAYAYGGYFSASGSGDLYGIFAQGGDYGGVFALSGDTANNRVTLASASAGAAVKSGTATTSGPQRGLDVEVKARTGYLYGADFLVDSYATSGSNISYGNYIRVNMHNNPYYGYGVAALVYGDTASTMQRAVSGSAYGNTAGSTYGLYGSASNGPGTGYGLYATSAYSNDYAGYFAVGRVRIGAAGTPAYNTGSGDLYVADAVEAGGEFYYSSPKTHYFSVSLSGEKERIADQSWDAYGTHSACPDGVECGTLYAINLPDRAEITALRVWGATTSTSHAFGCVVDRNSLSSTAVEVLGQVTSSNTSMTLTDTVIYSPEIDNANYRYFIYCYETDFSRGAEVRIYGIRVDYTVDGPE